MHVTMCTRLKNQLAWWDMRMQVCICESSQREGVYVEDLLYVNVKLPLCTVLRWAC